MRLIPTRPRALDVLGARAAALRALSALLRTGIHPREALEVWHEDAPESFRCDLKRLARRLALGEPALDALAILEPRLGPDAHSLQVIYAVARALGGDLSRMIDDLAATIEHRRDALQATLAAIAGMSLSARIVACLPLLCVPLLPASRAPLMDGAGALLIVLGVSLTLTGLRWMRYLTPQPPDVEDGVAALARTIARALGGGAGLHAALEVAARNAPADVAHELSFARRLTRLGLGWPPALERTGHAGLAGMSIAIERAARKGLPAAETLDVFASQRDRQAMQELDRSVRRAPILMAVPLVVCVLPAFLLLGVVPFLRGLAQ
ncbi:MAG: type II secretion system F family protein [Actinomycetota bacterium]